MATITGNLGVNQTLTGTIDRDRIYGDTRSTLTTIGGNDTINALDGDDYIYGDAYRDITGASTKGGNDIINGGAGNDTIYGDGNYSLLNGALGGNDTIDGGIDDDIITGDVRITITGAGSLGGNDDIIGGSGNDHIYGDSRDDITNGGQGGVDTVYGGDDNDRIYGDAGDDLINATGGGDFLYGQDGDDIIAGDAADDMTTGSVGGDDTLDGGIGNDTLFGDAGGNLLDGSQGGVDTITGGVGDDVIFGDAGEDLNNSAVGGNDILDGGDNNDLISGDAGNELKNGSIGGDDNIQGGDGDDKLYGDAVDSFLISAVGGIDTIDGGLGADIISGDAGGSFYDNSQGGNDVLMAGNDTTGGPNIIYGDAGNTIYLSSHGGNDTITGSGVTDIVYGDAGVDIYGNSTGGIDTINTLGGDDEISGDAGRSLFDFAVGGDDIINAGAGNDTIYGDAKLLMRLSAQGGDDTIHGGDNDDTISGDAGHKLYENAVGGDDILYGDDGDDLIVGDTLEYITSGGVGGNDTISGGAGNDTIHGDALRFISSTGFGGNDRLQGDAGNDLVYGDAGDDVLFYDWDVNNQTLTYSDIYSGGTGTDTLTILFTAASDVVNIQLALQDYATFLAGTPTENVVFDFNPYGFDLLASGFEILTSNPIAQNDAYALEADDLLTAEQLFINDINPGVVTEVDGQASSVGNLVTLASGATLTVNANGSFDFNTNNAYNGVTPGQTVTETFTYTVNNGLLDISGNPITSTATVALSITKVNAAPIALDDTNFNASEDTTLSYADIVIADSPIVYYRFEEASGSTVIDYSASGLFDGTYHAPDVGEDPIVYGAGSVTAGLGNAATFQGFENSAVDIPTLTGVDFSNGFSVEAWVQVELAASAEQIIFGHANGYVSGSIYLQYFQNSYMFSIHTPTADIRYLPPTGNWEHVVITMDADGTMHLYKDAVEQSSISGNPAGPRTFNPNLNTSIYAIGGTGRLFTGLVDEFAIYNVALDPLDIAEHYAQASVSNTASINVLSNDSDPDLHPFTVISVTDPVVGTPVAVVAGTPTVLNLSSGGIITIQSNGNVGYDANSAFETLAEGSTATDSFTYTISDGFGGTDSATVTVTIAGVNDAPEATNNNQSITEDDVAPVSGNLLTDDDGFGVDQDIDIGDSITVTSVGGEANPVNNVVGLYGSLDWDSNGSYSYTLDSNNPVVQSLIDGESLTDTFNYQITDSLGLTATANLSITINGVNDAPIATDDTNFNASEDTTLSYADIVIADSPIVYYRFEEASGSTVIDYSASGLFDGTYHAPDVGEDPIVYGAGSVTAGLGNAATFQGFENSAVDIPTLTGVDFSNGFSVEAWVQVELAASAEQIIFGHANGYVSGSIYLQYFQNSYMFSIEGPRENIKYSPPTGNWEHVVISMDADGTMHLYKDSVEQSFIEGKDGATNNPAGPRTFNPNLNTSIYAIGGTGRLFTGLVDEFAIYNVALDPLDIAEHYAQASVSNTASINVLSNDSDPDLHPFTVISVTDPVVGTPVAVVAGTPTVLNLSSGGIITMQSNGNVGYDANSAFETLAEGSTATDSFTYTISDGFGGTDSATVTVTIAGVNDAPEATNNSQSITEDDVAPVSGNLLTDDDGFGVDQDIDIGDSITVTLVGGEANPLNDVVGLYGSLDWDSNGSYSYTLDSNNPVVQGLTDGESLTDTFNYQITDSLGLTATANLTITIAGVNDAPEATNNSQSITEDDVAPVSGNLLTDDDGFGVDQDIDIGDSITVTLVGGEANPVNNVVGLYGSLDWDSNGSYSYTLDSNNPVVQSLTDGESLTDTFNYQITDSLGLTATANLSITINGVNDAPIATDDTNFNASEDATLSYADIVIADSPIVYYRFEEASGSTVIDYSASGLFDGTYHAPDVGEDPVVYGAGSATAGLGNAATFQGFKNSAVDIPTLTGVDFSNGFSVEAWVQVEQPAAARQNIFGYADGYVPGSIYLQKYDNSYMFSIHSPIENIQYSPPTGNWEHVVISMDADGTMHLYKDAVEQSFTAGLGGATNNPAGPRTFNPNLNTSPYVIGGDPFNAGRFFTGLVDEFAIYNVALDPLDIAEHYAQASASNTASINVLSNDSDPDLHPFTVISVTDPVVGTPVAVVSGTPTVLNLSSGGIITMQSNGNVSYVANSAFETLAEGSTATDSFTYTISDGYGGTDSATVTVTIAGVNDAPEATNNSQSITEDDVAPVSGNLLTDDDGFGVDQDIDSGDSITVTLVGGEANPLNDVVGLYGSLDWDSNGAYSYTLDNLNPAVQSLAFGDSITDSFNYQITDSLGLTATANLSITINGANDAPIATDDAFSVTTAPTSSTEFGTFSGSDPGEGLDLSGEFPYAINVLGPAVGLIGDANFTADTVSGFSLSAQHAILNWLTPNYDNGAGGSGGGPEGALETIMQSIRWSSAPNTLSFDFNAGIEVGAVYKLQLLLAEHSLNRGFDIFVEGDQIADDLSLLSFGVHGSAPQLSIVVTHTFTASDAAINVILDGSSTDSGFSHTDPILQGVTLEKVTTGLLGNDTDVDLGDVLSVTAVEGLAGNVGTQFALTSGALLTVFSNGTFDYDPNGAFDSLAEAQTATDSFDYTISDGNGGTDTATATITITGENDAPLATDNAQFITENTILPVLGNLITDEDGFGVDQDIDIGDSITVTLVGGESNPLNDVTGLYGNLDWDSNGSYSYTLDSNNPVVQGLAAGESLTDTFNYQITDSLGLTATATLDITINGANDTPTAVDDSYFVAASNTGAVALTAFGTFTGSDPGEGLDLSGDLMYAINVAGPTVGLIGDANFTNETVAGFSLSATSGSATWISPNYDAGDGGSGGGAEGALETVMRSLHWSSNPANLLLNFNDGIEVGAVYQLQLLFAESFFNRGFDILVEGDLIADNFSTLSFGVQGTTPTESIVVTYRFTASDASVNVVLDGSSAPGFTNNDPIIQGATLEKLSSATLIGNDTDADLSDALSITAVEGLAGNVGTQFALTSGALLTVFSNGTFDYDPNGAFDSLTETQTATDSFDYTISDGNGGTDTATATITVQGENDAPVVADQLFAIHENSDNGTSVGFVLANDVDAGAVLTYNITGGTGATAFTIDTNTGEITVLDSPQLDFETITSLTLALEVSDGSLTDTALITIDLLDVIEGDGGNNSLNATALDDVMTGNGGSDIFVIGLNTGNDIITDFDALDDNEDIDLTAYSTNITAILANATQELSDVVIDLAALGGNPGDDLTLEDVTLANLDANDFLL